MANEAPSIATKTCKMSLTDQNHVNAPWSISLLIAGLLVLGCNKDKNTSNEYSIIELSGNIDSTVIIPDRSEVRIPVDLSFTDCQDCAFIVEGDIRLRLGAGVSCEFPPIVEFPDDATIDIDALELNQGQWHSLIFTSGDVTLANARVRNGLAGLDFNNCSRVELSNCQFSQLIQTAIAAYEVDTMKVVDCDFLDIERICLYAEYGDDYVKIDHCTFDGCEDGIRLNTGQIFVTNSLFRSCSEYGIYTRLEGSSIIEHNLFEQNAYHIWNQSTEGLTMRYNQFLQSSQVPMKFVAANGIIDVSYNNILPTATGYYINLSWNDLYILNNYWYSTDSLTIQQGMYDGRIDPIRGLVFFSPFLLAPVAEAGIQP